MQAFDIHLRAGGWAWRETQWCSGILAPMCTSSQRSQINRQGTIWQRSRKHGFNSLIKALTRGYLNFSEDLWRPVNEFYITLSVSQRWLKKNTRQMLMWQIVIKMLAFLDRYFSRDASIKKPSNPVTQIPVLVPKNMWSQSTSDVICQTIQTSQLNTLNSREASPLVHVGFVGTVFTSLIPTPPFSLAIGIACLQ